MRVNNYDSEYTESICSSKTKSTSKIQENSAQNLGTMDKAWLRWYGYSY